MSCLAIIERAYRGTIEEQYAHILWLSYALHKMNVNMGVLLRGNAILYGLQEQSQPQLTIGRILVKSLPHYESSLKELIKDGVNVYVYSDDCKRLQINSGQLIPGIIEADLHKVTQLCEEYDFVWYW
ncbi:DsrE family protein [Nostoc favosum]|uniref:DsrE family protein n=1 Tax=Nostoc favosum CHAB5714 TaxID=2780399 RepID=A0ABS8IG89_9NOSO|nr:DsrE family protein [Nostoc favosum]MCC5603250.1 DsrE family protein [Nostoc favosum CHAB5714]